MMDVKKTFVTYDVLSYLELQTIHWFPQSQRTPGSQLIAAATTKLPAAE